jgi:DNA-binding response OmpR family regulator
MGLRILVVEDDARAAHAIARKLSFTWDASVVIALTGRAAIAELDANDLDAVIADIWLTVELSGIDVLIAAREKRSHACRAALTGDFDRDLVHRAGLLGAYFMCKPVPENVLGDFIVRAERRRSARASLDEYVALRAASWRLSPKQLHILRWLLKGGERESYCTTFGIEPSTLKTQLKRMRAKVRDADSVEEIVHRLLLDLIEERAADEQ